MKLLTKNTTAVKEYIKNTPRSTAHRAVFYHIRLNVWSTAFTKTVERLNRQFSSLEPV